MDLVLQNSQFFRALEESIKQTVQQNSKDWPTLESATLKWTLAKLFGFSSMEISDQDEESFRKILDTKKTDISELEKALRELSVKTSHVTQALSAEEKENRLKKVLAVIKRYEELETQYPVDQYMNVRRFIALLAGIIKPDLHRVKVAIALGSATWSPTLDKDEPTHEVIKKDLWVTMGRKIEDYPEKKPKEEASGPEPQAALGKLKSDNPDVEVIVKELCAQALIDPDKLRVNEELMIEDGI